MRRRLPIARRRGRSPDLRLRGELEQSPALAILEQPDRPVRALFDGAYVRAHVEALRLARAVAVELHPHQRLRRQTADAGVALPVGDNRPRIDQEATRAGYRTPHPPRHIHIRARARPGALPAAVVVA